MNITKGPSAVPACSSNRPAVRPIVSVKCGSCDGFGWVETGFVSDTNVGRGHQCRACLGTGFVEREAGHA
jgi:hypothetical protein